MATNKILKTVKTQLEKNPSFSDCAEALEALQEYMKIRKTIESVFTSGGETRTDLIDQYFQIRRLLDACKIESGKISTDEQSMSVKKFPLVWEGNKTAALYWSSGQGWSVEHRQFNKELAGVWEEFSLDDLLDANQVYFTEYVDD